jgi:hypothetical protein
MIAQEKRIEADPEKRGGEQITLVNDSPGAKAVRGSWVTFIGKVYEVDPLSCPGVV